MNITSGKIHSAQKCVIYGSEGVGKSTLASKFPEPLFIDTEGSTKHLDVRRFDPPSSWAMLMSQVQYVINNPSVCKTLIIDTTDWAERFCVEAICARGGVNGLEGFGYGKGYVYLKEEFGRLLNLLSEVILRGVHVVMTAHATTRKFERPEEAGAFDRWEMKLAKGNTENGISAMLKEWADLVLFITYKIHVIKGDEKKGEKNKAQGTQRVMYTTHHPAWDAKNRHGLPDELPLDFAAIAHIFNDPLKQLADRAEQLQVAPPVTAAPPPQSLPVAPALDIRMDDFTEVGADDEIDKAFPPTPSPGAGIDPRLWELMQASGVSEDELQAVIARRGTFPVDMPVANYPKDFIDQALIPDWHGKVMELVKEYRASLPL